jgi:hypothetical protein
MGALLDGVYDGDVTIRELLHAKRRFRPESKWRPGEEIAPAVPSSREAV